MFNRLFSLAALTIVLTWTGSAHAYLDPSSGSMMLQVILGGLAGLAVAGKLFWQRIVAFFSFGKKHDSKADLAEVSDLSDDTKS